MKKFRDTIVNQNEEYFWLGEVVYPLTISHEPQNGSCDANR